MLLFHFTSLLNLPGILQHGITRGEVPVDPYCSYDRLPQAANLTTNGSPSGQDIWNRSNTITDKTKMRLTVDVPDVELTTFRQVIEKYRMGSSWAKVIAPNEHRRYWYFAFRGVRPEQINKVEIMEDGDYRQLPHGEVKLLVTEIEAEKALKLDFPVIKSGRMRGSVSVRLRPGFDDCWLFDGIDAHLMRPAA